MGEPLQGDAVPIPSGVPGLDMVLRGGFPANRIHLIEGRPGSGKTTIGLQFLLEGLKKGERGLYITLSETKRELQAVASAHGWSLDGLAIFELVPPELSLDPKLQQTLLYASDLELGETVQMVLAEVERVAPARIVFDSLSEIRVLSQGSLRYRRQVLALKHFFLSRNCTVLGLDDLTSEQDDTNLHSISHSVIRLEQLAKNYGVERRRMRIVKMRGTAFLGGYHDFVIRKGGVVVFPRLIASEHLGAEAGRGTATSGVPELDQLLGGGLDRGTSTLIMGPSGSGKSSLSLQCVKTALERGEKALIVSFDETQDILLKRARGIGFELRPSMDSGALTLRQVDPADLSPGELSDMVYRAVRNGARFVVLDSLSGYQNAMPEEQFVLLQMHELLTFLNQQGVVTILVLAQHGLVGPMQSALDLTYLSDTIILLRFFEAAGRIRRAVSVLKKRTGSHEDTIREYRIGAGGIRLGEPLLDFHGVLMGVPTYTGQGAPLLGAQGGK